MHVKKIIQFDSFEGINTLFSKKHIKNHVFSMFKFYMQTQKLTKMETTQYFKCKA